MTRLTRIESLAHDAKHDDPSQTVSGSAPTMEKPAWQPQHFQAPRNLPTSLRGIFGDTGACESILPKDHKTADS